MSSTLCKRSISGNRQQEMKMRDVMGGLEEIATMLSYNPWPGDFEIIAIYPAEQDDIPSSEKIVIRANTETNVISYQERKAQALKLSA